MIVFIHESVNNINSAMSTKQDEENLDLSHSPSSKNYLEIEEFPARGPIASNESEED